MATSSTQNPNTQSFTSVIEVCFGDFFTTFNLVKEKRIGKGMSGNVFLATSADNPDVKRAVKVFEKSNKSECHFKTETAILQQVQHPYIINDVKAFSCPDHFILSMPYCPAGSLKKNLVGLSASQILRYLLQLTAAVRHLHVVGVVHRDIKPANILVTETDDVKLIDFGLARKASSKLSQKRRKAGTKGYMAPELSTEDDLDLFKCDMYSVGVVLWNMMFVADKQPDKGYLHYLDKYRNNMSVMYSTTLENLLHADPKVRWTSLQLIDYLATFPVATTFANRMWGDKK